MKQCINIKQIKQLNIIQLNELVISLDIEEFWQGAKMRTLRYEEDVLQKIADTCCVGKMIEIISDSWIDKIYSVNYDHEIYKMYKGELCDNLWEVLKSEIGK